MRFLRLPRSGQIGYFNRFEEVAENNSWCGLASPKGSNGLGNLLSFIHRLSRVKTECGHLLSPSRPSKRTDVCPTKAPRSRSEKSRVAGLPDRSFSGPWISDSPLEKRGGAWKPEIALSLSLGRASQTLEFCTHKLLQHLPRAGRHGGRGPSPTQACPQAEVFSKHPET